MASEEEEFVASTFSASGLSGPVTVARCTGATVGPLIKKEAVPAMRDGPPAGRGPLEPVPPGHLLCAFIDKLTHVMEARNTRPSSHI